MSPYERLRYHQSDLPQGNTNDSENTKESVSLIMIITL